MSFYRFPRWSAFVFVFTAMSIAVLYHNWKNITGPGQMDFGSLATSKAPAEIIRCQCVKPGRENSSLLKLEEANKCVVNELDVTQWPPLFRLERGKVPNEFSALCVLPTIRDQLQSHSSSCLHQEYLNVVYNFIGDLTNCLDIPQREFLALVADKEKPQALTHKSWDHLSSRISEYEDYSCKNIKSVLHVAGKDPFLKSIAELGWHFKMTLEGTRNLAAKTEFNFELPIQWETWVIMRALDASSVTTISEIRQIQKRGIASRPGSGTDSEKANNPAAAQELIKKWSETPYIKSLLQTRDRFNDLFQEGTCVPESFLQQ
jgi:hypothetical protein